MYWTAPRTCTGTPDHCSSAFPVFRSGRGPRRHRSGRSGRSGREPRQPRLVVDAPDLHAILFAFACDSCGFGVIPGEQTCGRAYVESAMCGAVLGIGSTGLMIGLTWLVNSYGYTGEPLKLVNLVNLVSAVVSAIVALMVMVSAQGYAKAVLYPSACRDPVTRRHIRPDQRGYARRDLSLDQTHPNRHGAVRWATRSSVLFVLISALTVGAAAASPGKDRETAVPLLLPERSQAINTDRYGQRPLRSEPEFAHRDGDPTEVGLSRLPRHGTPAPPNERRKSANCMRTTWTGPAT